MNRDMTSIEYQLNHEYDSHKKSLLIAQLISSCFYEEIKKLENILNSELDSSKYYTFKNICYGEHDYSRIIPVIAKEPETIALIQKIEGEKEIKQNCFDRLRILSNSIQNFESFKSCLPSLNKKEYSPEELLKGIEIYAYNSFRLSPEYEEIEVRLAVRALTDGV